MKDCWAPAQVEGALAFDGIGCLPVFGKTVKITDSEHSVEEGFRITNFNFHTSGYKPATPTQHELPGNPQTMV